MLTNSDVILRHKAYLDAFYKHIEATLFKLYFHIRLQKIHLIKIYLISG